MSAQTQPVSNKKSLPSITWISTGISICGIWLAVVLASIVAPDLVSGSQHEHLHVASGDWIWGLIATAFVVLAVQFGMRLRATNPMTWIALAFGVVAVWAGVVFVSAFGPVLVTGTDPSTIPYGAMGAPVLGTFLTWFVCTLVKSGFEQDA